MPSKKQTTVRLPRVLVGILGVDIHVRAARILSQKFRDAGMEVIYLGYGQTPEMIARAARDEDVDVVCISSHCGYHRTLMPIVKESLKEVGCRHVPIVLGGGITDDDIPGLEEIGITGNFGPGSSMDQIIEHVTAMASKARASKERG